MKSPLALSRKKLSGGYKMKKRNIMEDTRRRKIATGNIFENVKERYLRIGVLRYNKDGTFYAFQKVRTEWDGHKC